MERYKLIKEVGGGSFGSAVDKQSCEVVAIKRLKQRYCSWEEILTLPEVKSLCTMKHPNMMKLKEVIKEYDTVFFVFEYMEHTPEHTLLRLMQERQEKGHYLSEAEVKHVCFQVFQGLAYMHARGYMHRDLKPENLLVTKNVVKIADMGLARDMEWGPPFTGYVGSRWYRAPELMLGSFRYSRKIDIWTIGAIMAELYTLTPLFPGGSEADQMYKICRVLGSPTRETWSEGLLLAKEINYQFPHFLGVDLSALIPSASDCAIDLIASLCSWDPLKRPTAVEALQHPYFYSLTRCHIPWRDDDDDDRDVKMMIC